MLSASKPALLHLAFKVKRRFLYRLFNLAGRHAIRRGVGHGFGDFLPGGRFAGKERGCGRMTLPSLFVRFWMFANLFTRFLIFCQTFLYF